jgi:hypothetical protein
VLDALLKDRMDINFTNKDGDTALLLLCARNPNLEAIEHLLKAGAHVNIANLAGQTPLHIAVTSSNYELAKRLLQAGADPNIPGPNGTPVAIATGNLVELLTPKKRENEKPQHTNDVIIEVLEARHFNARSGLSDLYCLLKSGQHEYRTQVAYKTNAPVWGETFHFGSGSMATLSIELWKWHMAQSSQLLGEKTILLDVKDDAPMDRWIELNVPTPSTTTTCEVRLRIVHGIPSIRKNTTHTTTVNGRFSELLSLSDDTRFTSQVFPREEWLQLPACPGSGVDSGQCMREQYHIEAFFASVTHHQQGVTDFDESYSIPHYRLHFYGKDHFTIFGHDSESLPLVFSVEDCSTQGVRKVIMRTCKEDWRLIAPNCKDPVAAIKAVVPSLADMTLQVSRSSSIHRPLLAFEQNFLIRKHKYSLLYARPNQHTQQEILQNQHESPEFEAFKQILGTKVPLRNWHRYNGGLDILGESDGTHSLFSTFGDQEIMFHVPTMMPFIAGEELQMHRRRHIFADPVLLIFKETASQLDTIDLGSFNSKLHLVFLVVSPKQGISPNLQYRVTIISKPTLRPFPPFLPDDMFFQRDAAFGTFLLKKLINAERMSMESPSQIRNVLANMRKSMLNAVIQTLD